MNSTVLNIKKLVCTHVCIFWGEALWGCQPPSPRVKAGGGEKEGAAEEEGAAQTVTKEKGVVKFSKIF